MKNYFEELEKKLKENINFEEIIFVDNSHLHTHHKSFIPGKLHLHLKIKSKFLKSLSYIDSQRMIMKVLKEDLKTKIHALEITIDK